MFRKDKDTSHDRKDKQDMDRQKRQGKTRTLLYFLSVLVFYACLCLLVLLVFSACPCLACLFCLPLSCLSFLSCPCLFCLSLSCFVFSEGKIEDKISEGKQGGF